MSTDLMFAVVLFLVIVSAISLQWDNTLVRMDDVEKRTAIETKSHMVSNFLTKAPGHPIGWTCGWMCRYSAFPESRMSSVQAVSRSLLTVPTTTSQW
jgi:hypothetical protein